MNQLNHEFIKTCLAGIIDQYNFISKDIDNKEMVLDRLNKVEIKQKLIKQEFLKYYGA